jgi:aspartyl aminopeptidase
LVEEELNSTEKDKSGDKKSEASSIQENHHSALLAALSEELSVAPEEIHDFEL